ncbi:hypothetical protein L486_00574 [Kwoniella mangroviensis CBS 10435]|uniref:Short-chain dehydrogenase n=1 Tax=Kwoniella mangroviensis CBS 10435 TaxID=1331196 RepID=A0A1B9IZG6_9TREE|nr:hypothetical protein L486_00574 [Kwoniella mangroviensis CBS 10435]
MSGPTIVLITGANTGIGYQAALQLLLSHNETYKIFVGARSIEKSQQAIKQLRQEATQTKSELEPLVVDLEDDESIKRAYEEVDRKVEKLDVLVNNAGVLLDSQAKTQNLSTRQLFLQTFNTNVFGVQVLTETFIPLLLKSTSPRLLFLGTSMSSLTVSENPNPYFNHPPPAGWPKENSDFWAYKSSKLALMMIMRDWSKNLKNDNVKVWGINPGLVATNSGGSKEFLKSIGAGDPAVSGRLIRDVIEGERDGYVGKLIATEDDYFGSVVPW